MNELSVSRDAQYSLCEVSAKTLTELSGVPLAQRFSLAGPVHINKYGSVGMLVLDSRPGIRHVSYDEDEWIGIEVNNNHGAYDHYKDPNRFAHYIGTEHGCGLIRWFVHPHAVREFFDKDRFLGGPLIDKCQRHPEVIPESFDEMTASVRYDPCQTAEPLILAITGWLAAEIPGLVANWDAHKYPAHWPYLSFHPWVAFRESADIADLSIRDALMNVEQLLDRAQPKESLQIWDEAKLPLISESCNPEPRAIS